MQGYAKNLTFVLQDVTAAVGAGRTASRDLQAETRSTLAPALPAGSVKYAWTQVGTDDTPFSKLEITGIVPGPGRVPTVPTLSIKATLNKPPISVEATVCGFALRDR